MIFTCSTYHVGVVEAAEDVELLPGVVLPEEPPGLGALDGAELLGEQAHAAEVQLRRVAEVGELQRVHDGARGEPGPDRLRAPPLQPRHGVGVRQHQQLLRVPLHVLVDDHLPVAAPADCRFRLISSTNLDIVSDLSPTRDHGEHGAYKQVVEQFAEQTDRQQQQVAGAADLGAAGRLQLGRRYCAPHQPQIVDGTK